MTGHEIRKRFLEYFKKHHHKVVRSSSLVPHDDPTLLFTNAGMVQFKRTFLGEEKRDYARAATSQKCVRAGGKHNDLENVGYTARHHTFFEMLGNFSFGDYFKEKAIEFAWDLLTNGYGLSTDKLWISVYLEDDEAYDLWHRKIGVPENRIVRLGEADNFWSMGDTGPCGPCSEIHIDRGAECGCGRMDCGVDCDCDRFLEIWNLVFMQFDRDSSGTLTPLPKPSIDTGLGLERMAAILQGGETNFETDLILPIIRKAEEISNIAYGGSAETDVAMKVIADHSRSAAFLIGDGVLPSNEGRGYVLRRIMRRAIRYGRNIGLTRPFLHETAAVVFQIMKDAYPELAQASAFIDNVIKNEELRFTETLDNGLKILNDALSEMKANGQRQVPGDLIFKLYDTYGFPVDIVSDVIRDENMSMDMAGFDHHMEIQRKQSRSVTKFAAIGDAYKNLPDDARNAIFTGYETLTGIGRIVVVVKDGAEIAEAGADSQVELVTDTTPFYSESGGQVGDRGLITAEGLEIVISDTVKDPTGLIIHRGTIRTGTVKKGDDVVLTVDTAARRETAQNHTATHILHAVLRQVLGDHVKQAGSHVAPDRLRFDFTHFSQVDPGMLNRIESTVNRWIRENVAVHTEQMAADKALKSGATALFEEKYGEEVRVVSLAAFSKELCGGTHVQRTGDIGFFKIVSESSIASGVRRIEACTGESASAYIQEQLALLQRSAHILKEKPQGLPDRIESVVANQKAAEKEVAAMKAKLAEIESKDTGDETRLINGVPVFVKKVTVDTPAALRDLADKIRDKFKSGVIALGTVVNGKVLLIIVVTKDLKGKFHAGNIVKAAAEIVGGGGGGRPDMAQAGGTQPEHLDKALEKVCEIVAQHA